MPTKGKSKRKPVHKQVVAGMGARGEMARAKQPQKTRVEAGDGKSLVLTEKKDGKTPAEQANEDKPDPDESYREPEAHFSVDALDELTHNGGNNSAPVLGSRRRRPAPTEGDYSRMKRGGKNKDVEKSRSTEISRPPTFEDVVISVEDMLGGIQENRARSNALSSFFNANKTECARLLILGALFASNTPLSPFDVYSATKGIWESQGVSWARKTMVDAVGTLIKLKRIRLVGEANHQPSTRREYELTEAGERFCQNLTEQVCSEKESPRLILYSHGFRLFYQE